MDLATRREKEYIRKLTKKSKVILKMLKKKPLEEDSKTVLLYEAECSMSNTATVSYKWGVRGKQPFIECKQRESQRQTIFRFIITVVVECAWWYVREKITNKQYVMTLKERKIEFWKTFSPFSKTKRRTKKSMCN